MMTIIASTVGVIAGVSIFGFAMNKRKVRCLENAKIGEIYNFVYRQPVTGTPERYLAKVIDVTTLSEDSIRNLNRRSNYRRFDPIFVRTPHLVTCQTPDGKIRNFYAERTSNCRRPLLAKFVFGTRLAKIFS